MYGEDELPPQFAAGLAAMEEARAQYRADHERALADDEARQAEFAKLVEQHREQAEQARAEREAAAGTEADPAASEEAEAEARRAAEEAEQAARRAAQDEQDAAVFRFEDQTAEKAGSADPVPRAVPRRPVWDEDDFSSTNWVDD
ncbi:hypothetical protein GCM10022222_22410 [Amycolatopsis ultiminotia]|uniref:Uncharacterized protein n=1 Tax=Amycolatopsis ultiminotia TaxID=543629 RepID=A0ABP6VMD7_9PSEU